MIKTWMRTAIVLAMTHYVLFSRNTASAEEKIKIGFFLNEPQTICRDAKCTGSIIEYWEKYVGPEMAVKIEWDGPLPPERLFDSLVKGEINCIALLAKNDERIKLYDYPDDPFFMMNAGIAVLKTSKLQKVSSVADLSDLTIGFFSKGFTHSSLKDVKIKWDLSRSVDWQTRNFEKVIHGRIDALYDADMSALLYKVKTTPAYAEKLNVLSVPNTQAGLYSVFSKADKGKFLRRYNEAHKTILKKVSYQSILEKYL